MGECGCGELRPHEVLQLGNEILAVEIYEGCEYCDTGIMVTLNLLNKERADEIGLEPTGELKPDKYGWGQTNYPIIAPEDLIDAAKKLKSDEAFGDDGYDSLTDYLSDEGLELLQTALRIRLEKTAAENARVAKLTKGR